MTYQDEHLLEIQGTEKDLYRRPIITPEQSASFVFANSVAAFAEIQGMVAENTFREQKGETVAYGEEAFLAVIEKYGIHHNAVLSLYGNQP